MPYEVVAVYPDGFTALLRKDPFPDEVAAQEYIGYARGIVSRQVTVTSRYIPGNGTHHNGYDWREVNPGATDWQDYARKRRASLLSVPT